MGRFHFSLEAVLDVRRAERDERRSELAAARRRHETVLAQVSDGQRALAALRVATRRTLAVGPVDLPRLHSCRCYGTALQTQREALQTELQRAADQIEQCRAALAEAERRVRELEKLRERRHACWERDRSLAQNASNRSS